jgi:lipopolysaccharide biosynthesis regulator YciM
VTPRQPVEISISMQVPIPARIGWFGKNEKTRKNFVAPSHRMSRGFLFALNQQRSGASADRRQSN